MNEDESHLRHCILYEDRKGSQVLEVVKNTSTLYGNKVNVLDCERCWSFY